MTEVDPYVQAVRDLLVTDRDERIAEALRWADEAKAAGHEPSYRSYQRDVAWLKAYRFSWEKDAD